MLRVEQLSKHYGDFVAVQEVSFQVAPGELFGLLGPNGAGKSTTIGCLCGLLSPTSGTVQLDGKDIVRDGARARQTLGVVPQEIALYEELSARENLRYWGVVYGLQGAALQERITEVLEQVGLLDRAEEPASQLSGGMQRRLNLACSILHRPKILLLDEATVGVDPQSRVRILELIRSLAEAGTAVVYTTHYMEEAEQLCDRLAIIDKGQIIAQGSLEELRALHGERDLLRLAGSFPAEAVREALQQQTGLEVLQLDKEQLTLAVQEASARLPELFGLLAGAGAEIRETTLTRPSLESLFIKLTGKELRD